MVEWQEEAINNGVDKDQTELVIERVSNIVDFGVKYDAKKFDGKNENSSDNENNPDESQENSKEAEENSDEKLKEKYDDIADGIDTEVANEIHDKFDDELDNIDKESSDSNTVESNNEEVEDENQKETNESLDDEDEKLTQKTGRRGLFRRVCAHMSGAYKKFKNWREGLKKQNEYDDDIEARANKYMEKLRKKLENSATVSDFGFDVKAVVNKCSKEVKGNEDLIEASGPLASLLYERKYREAEVATKDQALRDVYSDVFDDTLNEHIGPENGSLSKLLDLYLEDHSENCEYMNNISDELQEININFRTKEINISEFIDKFNNILKSITDEGGLDSKVDKNNASQVMMRKVLDSQITNYAALIKKYTEENR